MRETDQDRALISAAQAGSVRAWEQLVKRHERRVYNYGLRLTGNAADAMDLMQEVFLGVYRNLRNFRGEAKFTSWLFRIAHNKAADMSRRQRHLSIHDVSMVNEDSEDAELDYEHWSADSANDPEEIALSNDSNQRIVALLKELSWEQRMQIELKIYQSLTFEEIAQMQEISVNTAKTRFYTALTKLKSMLENEHVV